MQRIAVPFFTRASLALNHGHGPRDESTRTITEIAEKSRLPRFPQNPHDRFANEGVPLGFYALPYARNHLGTI